MCVLGEFTNPPRTDVIFQWYPKHFKCYRVRRFICFMNMYSYSPPKILKSDPYSTGAALIQTTALAECPQQVPPTSGLRHSVVEVANVSTVR